MRNNKKYRFISGIKDTRNNNEDFAITPYLFGISVKGESKVIGFGICWDFILSIWDGEKYTKRLSIF